MNIPEKGTSLALVKDENVSVLPQTELDFTGTESLSSSPVSVRLAYSELDRRPSEENPHLVLPVNPPEVWACGVTYTQSRTARELETQVKGIYDRVYEAERPEIFFKATTDRCVGPNDFVGIRGDSHWSVPEPELAVVVGRDNQVFGYTIGDDVTARDIERENPLYLPQAKVYSRCCALGPVIVTADDLPNPYNLDVICKVIRAGSVAFEGSVNTSVLRRRIPELLRYLHQYNSVPPGSVLLTGTGIVPPDSFSLREMDSVEIAIRGIGVLRNTVLKLDDSSVTDGS